VVLNLIKDTGTVLRFTITVFQYSISTA